MAPQRPRLALNRGEMLDWIKAHPIITSFCAVSTVLGGVLGPLFTPEDWSDGRKIAAGVVTGVGCAAIVVFNRIFGAFAHDIEDDGR